MPDKPAGWPSGQHAKASKGKRASAIVNDSIAGEDDPSRPDDGPFDEPAENVELLRSALPCIPADDRGIWLKGLAALKTLEPKWGARGAGDRRLVVENKRHVRSG